MRSAIEGILFIVFSVAMLLLAMGFGALALIIFAVHTLP